MMRVRIIGKICVCVGGWGFFQYVCVGKDVISSRAVAFLVPDLLKRGFMSHVSCSEILERDMTR